MYEIIKYLFPDIQDWQFSLQDDGNGPYISYWIYPLPQPTQAEMDAAAPAVAFLNLVRSFDAAIEAHLHDAAMAAGYTNIERACMYSGAPNPYQAESQSFVTWAGNVWAYCRAELAKVQAGTRPTPTIAEIISELPARVVP
jgi:hypothetical protein